MVDAVGSCHFKTTKGSAVGSLHALCVCKVNQNRSAFHLNASTFWAFGHKLLAKTVSERLEGEALSDGALVTRMHVAWVSEVATYCHPSVGQCFGKATLTVAEVRPRMAGRDAAELHEVEGQFRFVKIVAPTLFEERKELFVEFNIVGVALTLVPNHTLWVQALQGAHTRIKKVVRHEGMTLQGHLACRHIALCSATRPILSEVALRPAVKHLREVEFKRTAVNPAFRS